MKKLQILLFAACLLSGVSNSLRAQQHLMIKILEKSTSSPEYFQISDNTPGSGMKGTKGFFIRKIDRATKKDIFKVELEIPEGTVMRYPLSNFASFDLVGESIVVVYDVIQKSSKVSFLRIVNAGTGKIAENIPVFTDKVKSVFNMHDIVYKVVYSPDYSKAAILKDNLSPENDVNAEIMIYDLKNSKFVSNINLGQKYNGTKRVFDFKKIQMDNNANIQLAFSLMNEKTKMTTKTYVASLPANSSELKDVKEEGSATLADGKSQISHGRFYNSLKDYINNKPIEGVRIKNGSYHYSVVSGNDFQIIDEEGNLQKQDAKNMPSDLFTYKERDYMEPSLVRIIDSKPYVVLATGKFSYYALYLDNTLQYYSEGWESADLKGFKEKTLKEYLKQYGLLEEYENTMPKRELSTTVNGWFNLNVNHNIKYINKLNELMSK